MYGKWKNSENGEILRCFTRSHFVCFMLPHLVVPGPFAFRAPVPVIIASSKVTGGWPLVALIPMVAVRVVVVVPRVPRRIVGVVIGGVVVVGAGVVSRGCMMVVSATII